MTPPPVPTFEVLDAGPHSTFQDLGRYGYASMGVSPSGAFDRTSAARANSAVGNAPDAVVLEILMGGFAVRALRPAHLAITGARSRVTVTTHDGRLVSHYSQSVISVEAGDEISVLPADHGLRTYIAVHGGYAQACVLGSASFDSLSGLGPAPLQAGDVIATHGASSRTQWSPAVRTLPPHVSSNEPATLTFIRGPRDDWFTNDAFRALCSQDYWVLPDSNRVGIRAEGGIPLERSQSGELPSEPMVRGSIQVPPSGQPVIFGPDHPVTGGYPVIGVLTHATSDLSGQLSPGQRFRFQALHRT